VANPVRPTRREPTFIPPAPAVCESQVAKVARSQRTCRKRADAPGEGPRSVALFGWGGGFGARREKLLPCYLGVLLPVIVVVKCLYLWGFLSLWYQNPESHPESHRVADFAA
jgi:hypothetical protein